MTMDITRETFIWRICYALLWSIAIHYILFSTYICLVNFNLWNINIINLPFQALLSIHNLYILPLAAIMFFKGVILSRNYFTQIKTEIIFKRLHLFMNCFTFHNFLGLLFHVLLGIAIPFFYTLTNDEYQSFNVDCSSDESPNIYGGTPVCLNEAKFFLICAGVWNGFYSYYKYYIFNLGCLIFPFIQQNKFIRIKTSIYSTVKNAMYKAITPCMLFCVIYYFKGNVPRSYFSFIKDLKLSSDLIDCLYGVFKIKLLLNLWFFATIYFVTIDLMQILMIVFLTERISFPITKYTFEEENRGLLLKDALACASIPIIHYHGYLDLSLLSQYDSSKRAEVFALSQPGGHPHTWNVIVAECLKIINKLTDDINNCTPSSHSNILDQLRNSNILKKTDMHESTIQEVQYQKMRCLSPRINNCTDNTSLPTLYDSYEKLIQICREWLKNKVDAFYKKPIVIYFLGELTEPKIKHVYCQSQPVIWAIEGLSFLICHSLEEDPYGVVQKDISKIISAFLNLKNSIEKLQKQCIFFGKSKKIESYDIQMRDTLKFSIKQSIYRIVITFKNYVNDLNLESDDLKSQLSNFVYFKEV